MITLHLDKSSAAQLHFETKEGEKVCNIERIFREGFTVTENDTPAVLTLLARFVVERDQSAM